MRSYKAARRAATLEPVRFQYDYEVEVPVLDAQGTPTGATRWEERSRVFECHGEVSTLLLSEFAANAGVDTATPEGTALIAEFFRQAFGSERAYQEFFRVHTRHGGHDGDDLLMDILGGLVEDFTGRPTVQPSASLPTPSQSGAPSKVVSFSRATVEVLQQPGLADAAVDPMAQEWAASRSAASSG